VTGAQDYGVFVAFCGGVRGLAPLSELGLQPGEDPAKHFAVGKVLHQFVAARS
jgi:ribosomal protein S1